MICQRAAELDLAQILQGTGGPAWESFRDHYPHCAECAAQMEVWTTMHGLLAPLAATAHPQPKKLLWFGERPQSLPAEDRHQIEAHLRTCRSCRDELTTLRQIDLHALTRPLAAIDEPVARLVPPLATPPHAQRIGWASQLAFAVIALGIVPLLYSRLQFPTAPPQETAPSAAPAAPPVAAPAPPAPVAAQPSGGASRSSTALRAPAPAEGKLGAVDKKPAPGAPAKGMGSAAAPAPPPPPPPSRVPSRQVGSEFDAPAPKAEASAPMRRAGRAMEQAPADETSGAAARGVIDAPDEEPAAAAPARSVALRAAGSVRVAADDRSPLTIRIPGRPSAGNGAHITTRIVDAAKRRELRQPGVLHERDIVTDIPGAWLTPGDYQVEVNVDGVLSVYRLTVTKR